MRFNFIKNQNSIYQSNFVILLVLLVIALVSCKTDERTSDNSSKKVNEYSSLLELLEIVDDSQVSNKLIVTAQSGLTIRSKPSLSGDKVGALPYEDLAAVIEDTTIELNLKDEAAVINGNWMKIKVPDTNRAGYVFGGFLSEKEDKVEGMYHHLKYRLDDLVETIMPPKDSVKFSRVKPSYRLSKAQWKTFGFEQLSKFNNTSFDCSIYKVINKDGGFVLFVERFYDYESFHWLCLVDDKLKLKDYIRIGFDNEHGIERTVTYFKKDKIIVDYFNKENTPKRMFTEYKIEDFKFKMQDKYW